MEQKYKQKKESFFQLFVFLALFLWFFFFSFFLLRVFRDNNTEEGGGGGIFGIMKKSFHPVSSNITFDDVKGNTEAKVECARLVEFLKTPAKFAGVKIPKGILLSGPPGTGKTLLAKALAGKVFSWKSTKKKRIQRKKRQRERERKRNESCILFCLYIS